MLTTNFHGDILAERFVRRPPLRLVGNIYCHTSTVVLGSSGLDRFTTINEHSWFRRSYRFEYGLQLAALCHAFCCKELREFKHDVLVQLDYFRRALLTV